MHERVCPYQNLWQRFGLQRELLKFSSVVSDSYFACSMRTDVSNHNEDDDDFVDAEDDWSDGDDEWTAAITTGQSAFV